MQSPRLYLNVNSPGSVWLNASHYQLAHGKFRFLQLLWWWLNVQTLITKLIFHFSFSPGVVCSMLCSILWVWRVRMFWHYCSFDLSSHLFLALTHPLVFAQTQVFQLKQIIYQVRWVLAWLRLESLLGKIWVVESCRWRFRYMDRSFFKKIKINRFVRCSAVHRVMEPHFLLTAEWLIMEQSSFVLDTQSYKKKSLWVNFKATQSQCWHDHVTFSRNNEIIQIYFRSLIGKSRTLTIRWPIAKSQKSWHVTGILSFWLISFWHETRYLSPRCLWWFTKIVANKARRGRSSYHKCGFSLILVCFAFVVFISSAEWVTRVSHFSHHASMRLTLETNTSVIQKLFRERVAFMCSS